MLLEAGSAKTIKVVGTAPSAAYQVVTCCKDISRASGRTTYTTLETTFDDDPVVEIVATPAEATDREVEMISIQNMSSGSETITVTIMGTGVPVNHTIAEFTLATMEIMSYTNKTGWRCHLAAGSLKLV